MQICGKYPISKKNTRSNTSPGRYIVLISVHGLIRPENLELGRDADTGGQTKYVLEMARALAEQPEVEKVDLVTKLVVDKQIDKEYSQPKQFISNKARLIRLNAGPNEYLPKEQLWDHLDTFADNLLAFLRQQPRLPDIIHSHYADAGYVGCRVANQLGIPLVHTGHSLGRVKRRRLLAAGLDADKIETDYNMSRRIEAEELTLASAERVITSTSQEIEEQYGRYDHYQPEQMRVIPPGTDLQLFFPPSGQEWDSPIAKEVSRFLNEPRKPIILALSRPDTRKNITSLVTAYGESKQLQKLANLVIIAGNREDLHDLDEGAQEVFTNIFRLVDLYDLYGKIAYPKHHKSDEVPVLYRLAAASGGVFVNPALTEPFGLTLIEAAASGLPIVATEDGGPRDIIGNCNNGMLVNPLDPKEIADAIFKILVDRDAWEHYSEKGLTGVRKHYSWEAHAKRYMEIITPAIDQTEVIVRPPRTRRPMLHHDRAIFTDLDQNLLGDPDSLPVFIETLRDNRKCATFGIATGRRLDSALKAMRKYGIPEPDVLITSGGSEIHYAPKLTMDTSWLEHIDYHWMPKAVRRTLNDLPGLKLQPKIEQSRFKISYYINPEIAPSMDEINRILHQQELAVNVTLSFGQFLDILPIRASKGMALRYFAARWNIPLEHILVAGGSGADEDMMRGNTLAVVVENRHHEELSKLMNTDQIYFASQPYAKGILEALDHYDFFRSCTVPEPEAEVSG